MRSVAVLMMLGVAGCGSSGEIELFVDLQTDLRPGVAFTSVETTLLAADGSVEDSVSTPVSTSEDFRDEPARIAEFEGFEKGQRVLRVELRRLDGSIVTERVVRILVESRRQVTLKVTSDCVSVDCPRPMDPRDATECLNGHCVPSDCTDAMEASCGSARCAASTDCDGTSECADVRCESGACLMVPDDSLCAPAEVCSVPMGCTSVTRDGGVVDGGTDSGTDAAVGCDDCDDGVFCNGAEACEGGACVSGSDPCPEMACDEAAAMCVSCIDDGDCTGDDVCHASSGSCVECLDDGDCSDGRWCDEPTSTCIECTENADCDDGLYCNGSETCGGGDCRSGSDPCPDGSCHETRDECRICESFSTNESCTGTPVDTDSVIDLNSCLEFCEEHWAEDVSCCQAESGVTCSVFTSPSVPQEEGGVSAAPCF